MTFLNNSIKQLQYFLNSLSKNADEVGLIINIGKTKCMSTNKIFEPLNIKIYNKVIEQVNSFVYLGHKLSNKNDGEIPVLHRIGLGWAAFEKNKVLLTSNRVPLHIKKKIYETYVLPVVLYGLECVNWTDNLCNKMEVF